MSQQLTLHDPTRLHALTTATEPLETIESWREDVSVGIAAQRQHLLLAGWSAGEAERVLTWLLAYRLGWLEATRGRDSTSGVVVGLAIIEQHLGWAEDILRELDVTT